MANDVETLEAAALKLTPEERAHLADRLIASLCEDPAVEEAWGLEVDHRLAEIEAGRMALVPAADAITRARDAMK